MIRKPPASHRRTIENRRSRGAKPRRRSAFLAAAFAAGASARAATFTVTTSGDSGAGSLRQAMLDANASPGADTIAFNIPGSGVHTLIPETILPAITDPVILDGFTQPGSVPNDAGPGQPDDSVHTIELDCVNGSSDRACITVASGGGGSTLRGLVINRCPGDGVLLLDSGGSNSIRGTFIGTDPTGAFAIGVGGAGVRVRATSDPSAEPGDVIGGESAEDRNLISGAAGAGVSLETRSNVVLGNFIGTNASGTGAIPNGTGIFIDGAENQIGGSTAGSRNVVSGNGNRGIVIGNVLGDPAAAQNAVQGNYVGTDAAGDAALGNGGSGIGVYGPDNAVGGPGAGEGNLVAANAGSGIEIIAGDQALVQGNRIGTDETGLIHIGNALAGIAIHAQGVQVGGLGTGEANTIAYAGAAGVVVFGGEGNTIRGNSIYSNADLGIDLGHDGANFNDDLDLDDGPNERQNYPVLSSVTTGTTTRVEGVLHSTPATSFTLDFYANPSCLRLPSDFLEGQTWLGSAQATTDGSGTALFDVTLPVPTEAGARVTLTATDPYGNTSEFSQRLPFSVTPDSGPADGQTGIAIAGTDFETGAQVVIGGLPATDVEVAGFNTITAIVPELAPGSLNDVTVVNPDGSSGTLEKGYVADFLDVPEEHQFYTSVTRLVTSAVTAGVGGGMYGVDAPTLRQQMAVFLLKAKHGACYAPPPCTGVFADVPCPSPFADWIEALAAEGITGGCGDGDYCPQNPVRRDQMAVFLLKGEHGPDYAPPPCEGAFADVPCPSAFAAWIEQLAAENITSGCGGGNYCPLANNTRGQMAVFLAKTFYLQ
jgi:hypothetical protein